MRTLPKAFIILAMAPWTADSRAAEPTDIGSRRELFVDRALIERLDGQVQLQLNHLLLAARSASQAAVPFEKRGALLV